MRWVWILAALVLASVSAAQRPIRGGDRLRVECEQEASLNREVDLSPSGIGSFGLLGALDVVGVLPGELARRLEALLVQRLSIPSADVRVSLLARADLPVRYGGAVARSGEVGLGDGLRLSDVVALAEPTQAADLAAVVIVGDDGVMRRVDFTRAAADPARFDPVLQSGDRVFFALATTSGDVFVLGGVARPRGVPADEARTVGEALEACGGLVVHANRRDVSVVRAEQSIRLVLPRDAAFPLRRGDTLRVGRIDDRTYVTVIGAVGAPGRVPFFAGMTLADVLAAAGGALPIADTGRIVLKSGTGVLRRDGAFGPGDLIEVPAAKPGSGGSLVERLWNAIRRIGG